MQRTPSRIRISRHRRPVCRPPHVRHRGPCPSLGVRGGPRPSRRLSGRSVDLEGLRYPGGFLPLVRSRGDRVALRLPVVGARRLASGSRFSAPPVGQVQGSPPRRRGSSQCSPGPHLLRQGCCESRSVPLMGMLSGLELPVPPVVPPVVPTVVLRAGRRCSAGSVEPVVPSGRVAWSSRRPGRRSVRQVPSSARSFCPGHRRSRTLRRPGCQLCLPRVHRLPLVGCGPGGSLRRVHATLGLPGWRRTRVQGTWCRRCCR